MNRDILSKISREKIWIALIQYQQDLSRSLWHQSHTCDHWLWMHKACIRPTRRLSWIFICQVGFKNIPDKIIATRQKNFVINQFFDRLLHCRLFQSLEVSNGSYLRSWHASDSHSISVLLSCSSCSKSRLDTSLWNRMVAMLLKVSPWSNMFSFSDFAIDH